MTWDKLKVPESNKMTKATYNQAQERRLLRTRFPPTTYVQDDVNVPCCIICKMVDADLLIQVLVISYERRSVSAYICPSTSLPLANGTSH
jgi:hypothetical protein